MLDMAERLRAAGSPVLDLTETNPTRCGFRYLAAAPESALAQPAARVYDPHPCGLLSARAAIAEYYGAQGMQVNPARLVLTAGTSEGYSHILRLLCNPGDAILVPSPSYPLLDLLARLNDVRLIPYPLHYDDRWWLDVDALRAAVDETCRAIVVINPNNPTGSYIKQSERAALVALAQERNLAIIADEVFCDYAVHADADRVGSFADETRVLTFVLNGVSKMLGLPQMKLAWLAVNGPEASADAARDCLEVLADTYLSVGTPVQLALPAWLAGRAATQAEIRNRVAANLTATRTLRHASCLNVEGGWSAVLRIPRTHGDVDFACDLLARDGVLVDPGTLFGLVAGGYVVVSLIAPPDRVAQGLQRLDARLAANVT